MLEILLKFINNQIIPQVYACEAAKVFSDINPIFKINLNLHSIIN